MIGIQCKQYAKSLFCVIYQTTTRYITQPGALSVMDYIQLSECKYTPFYCEENIWMLCKKIHDTNEEHLDCCHAVFISNNNQTVPLWHQKLCQTSNDCVVWDYHVILAIKKNSESYIYDFDSCLSFPCPFTNYVSLTIGSNQDQFQSKFHRWFRVVPGKLFLDTFASDRSHMLNEDLTWKKPPPDYPPIRSKNSSNNLQSFLNMNESAGCGKVMTLEDFQSTFTY